ncbi:MAG: HEAT repeat domain-containing protein [Candidatus Latescibacteria bacterium]|nr:HEAT repeat domain-containing protein [Candidatus Latescibacterota bacterium]
MKDTKLNATVEAQAPPEHVAAAEQVLKALTKLVAGRKIYAANNPRLEQFRGDLGAAMRRFFEFEDDLVLDVDQFVIRWSDSIVYENPRREESLAFLLYKDGVGELTFQPRSVGEEVDRLVEMMADELHSLGGDEDIVTRLWNANFEHIHYRVLDDYVAEEFGAGAADGSSEARSDETSDHAELLPDHPSFAEKGRVIVDQAETLGSIDIYLRGISGQHHHKDDEREAAYQKTLRSCFNVTNEETALYRAELEREKTEDGVAAFAEAILVFTLLVDASAVRDVTTVVERLVEYALHEKNPATLERVVRLVKEFRAREDLTDPVRQFCDKQLSRLADPDLVASFLEGTGADGRADAGVAYATVVGTPALDALVKTLHRAEGPVLHKRICDAILAIAGGSPQDVLDIIDHLDVDHPEEAIDAVYLAKALKVKALTPRLRELVFYPDARVKLEMLGMVAADDDTDATQLLLQSLGDLDKRVRIRVLEALAARNEPKVREKLGEMAFAKDLAERAPDEQEAIFKTLGSVGDAHTVDQLRSLLEKRKLIHLGKGNESKLLAIKALERVRERAALDVLTRLCEDSSEAVRLRAQRAKDHLAAVLAGKNPKGGEDA